MMDDVEYDIYDDLDVFKGNEKQQKECESCKKLLEQLNESQQKNAHLTNELRKIQESYEQLRTNSSAFMKTARQEVQRKDTRIKDLQKEKDDICFRRKKVKSTESKEAITQSIISCKPFISYELKRVHDESCKKSIDRNRRQDESDKDATKNPFASKSKENHDNKTNHLRKLGKSSSHRQQSRHQEVDTCLRSKHTNHRPKENERREQVDGGRSKRRRSPSISKNPKRARRSRSRSRSKRARERNVYERCSPDKVSSNSHSKERCNGNKEPSKRRSPRSPETHDLRAKLRDKHEKTEKHLHLVVTDVESSKIPSKDKGISDETITTEQITKPIETENVKDELKSIKTALEEGEIDDNSSNTKDTENNFELILCKPSSSEEFSVIDNKMGVNGSNDHQVDVKNEDRRFDVSKLIPVSVTFTEEVRSACTTPILPSENIDLQQQEQQQHIQLLNSIIHSPAAEKAIESKNPNGIAMETHHSTDVNVNKVELPFVNKCEIIETVDQTQLGSFAESNRINSEHLKAEIEPQPKLENDLQHNESIPQVNDGMNSSDTHCMIESFDDGSPCMHNTSGSKSVNISTSCKNYLIVENENNEQVIYVTRKKKKKKKKSLEKI